MFAYLHTHVEHPIKIQNLYPFLYL